jgi:hypothetical protein
MMKIFFFLICLFIFVCSCQQNGKPVIGSEQGEKGKNATHIVDTLGWTDTVYDKNGRIEEIMRGKKSSKKYLEGRSESYYSSGILRTIKYFHNDTARGNFLEFYPNGRLLRFSYLVDNTNSVYYREYDSSGILVSEQGNPFVGHDVKENSSLDTVHIQIFLSNYGFRSLQLYVSPDGEKYSKMNSSEGRDDGTAVFKMWKHTKGLNHISFYMKIIGIDSSAKQYFYKDTLSFQRPTY